MKLNERKQDNRDKEQSRDTRKESTNDNATDGASKRPLDWDARDLKANTWLRGSSGSYENRYFEQNED